ncbi:cytosolic protein [Methylomagnum sp.]
MNHQDDYDSPWKDAVQHDFPAFLAFYFPDIYRQIDWEAGFALLDQELRAIVREAEQGKRVVDLLVQVRRLDGRETWVYIQIEIQTQRDLGLPERVFVYHYRLFDRYQAPIASLVVLADPVSGWRPDRYGYELFGCEVGIRFPVVKLTDYAARLDELLADSNPFALVTAAHLLTQRTKGDDMARYHAKRRLVRLLYERGWDKQRVLDLFFIIDWLMRVPEHLTRQLWQEITEWEEEDYRMRYVTSFERLAEARGMALGEAQGEARGEARRGVLLLERLLERRFGKLPERIGERLRGATVEQSELWFDRALDAKDLGEVFDDPANEMGGEKTQ